MIASVEGVRAIAKRIVQVHKREAYAYDSATMRLVEWVIATIEPPVITRQDHVTIASSSVADVSTVGDQIAVFFHDRPCFNASQARELANALLRAAELAELAD